MAQPARRHYAVGDYVVGKQIGAGSFSTVWHARHRVHGTEVAIKEIATARLNAKLQESLKSEIFILKKIDHPHIIGLHDMIEEPGKIYIVLEYCKGGDLSMYIQQRRGIVSEATAKHFMQQLAEGLKVLRGNNLIHRDLKPQNLLLSVNDDNSTLKIADFGFARSLQPRGLAETMCGSPLYMAPEIMQSQKYDAKADLWSVGAILFQLVTGKTPFTGSNHIQLLENIIKSNELQFPPEAKDLNPHCIDLCRKLLRRNPVERLTFEEFFNHPYLSNRQPIDSFSNRETRRVLDKFPLSGRNTEESSQEDCLPFDLDDDPNLPAGSPSPKKSTMKSMYGFSLDSKSEQRDYLNLANRTEMGVIEDGSISGVLPSGSEAFAVHYPGYPSSTERAIETLGGLQQILKVRAEKSNKLELHFRPEDQYSHPAFGELQPCTNFLLKIFKKKVKNGHHEQLSADIVARVSEAYHFNGMVDYQHVLAVHADATRRKKRNFADIELESEKCDPVDDDQDNLMILVPPLFSLKDLPEKMILKPCGDLSLKKKDTIIRQRPEMQVEIDQCLAIDFNIKEIPKKVNWEKSIARESDLWKWQTIVCEMFEERPVWVKYSLADHLLDRGVNVADRVLKRLLFLAAYYFSNGPFMRFWIRKGYDPRKDPESRIYQRTDFRVPPPLRSYCDTNMVSGLTCRWKDMCEFQVFPRKAQISLQLFELGDDYIQQEIRKPATGGMCTLQTGWFSSQVLDILRLRVAQRFLSVYPASGAQSLLKSVTNRFEKLKILQITMKDKKAKQIDKEVLETEDKDTNDEVEAEAEVEDKEEDEDEMEDENLGEDVDIDEALDMADPERNFSIQDTYIENENENISKDYLQDLFGSFPSGSNAANGMQDEDPYDEEYHIYDQDSDGNFSNDEDY